MATKKRVKRYNGDDESMVNAPNRGIVDQTEEEAANEAEMMSSMMRKRAMEEGDRDEKALPAGYKVEAEAPAKPAPVMRKTAMPKPNFSNEGRSSKAPAPTPKSSVKTANVPKAIADFFRPKSASEKDSASRSALRESEKAKPKAQMGFKERYASRNYASGGSVSASSRADGIATKGKTRGKIC
jgi:hypothetical protein